MNISELQFMSRFPWSKKTKEFVSTLNTSVEEIINNKEIMDLASKRLVEIIKNGFFERQQDGFKEILVYIATTILAKVINDNYLFMRVAVTYQKIAEKELAKEKVGSLLDLAKSTFEINAKLSSEIIGGVLFEFEISFFDYLRASRRISGKKWLLINRPLKSGFVLLQKNDFVRLVSELVKNKIYSILLESVEIPKTQIIEKYVNPIESVLTQIVKRHTMRELGRVKVDLFPPCMKTLLSQVKKGENISHFLRFSLTTFLLNIGLSVDKILDLWRNAPDFDEDIARYQVEHIAGLKGSGTKYKTPSCKAIRTYGGCPDSDVCKNINNPLQFYFRNLKKKRREKIERER